MAVIVIKFSIETEYFGTYDEELKKYFIFTSQRGRFSFLIGKKCFAHEMWMLKSDF